MSASVFTAKATHNYSDGARRQVPGLDGLHRMTALLLEERLPADGRVLVLGAGGGMELDALARFNDGWRFDGVDPSPEMLALAGRTTASHGARIGLHEGYIQDAPAGPFDGAVSLLTFHFIAREERLETLRQLRARLQVGAPLVIAHISFGQDEPERARWIARHVAYGGTAPGNAEAARQAIGTRLTILSPEDEVALLAEAGFGDISLFYAAFSFRGWVAYAQ